jgi:hypothetical protein
VRGRRVNENWSEVLKVDKKAREEGNDVEGGL